MAKATILLTDEFPHLRFRLDAVRAEKRSTTNVTVTDHQVTILDRSCGEFLISSFAWRVFIVNSSRRVREECVRSGETSSKCQRWGFGAEYP